LQFVLAACQPWPGRGLDETDESADNILLALLARSINTYWSSVELSRIGLGEQAIMLNRSLFEDMVDAHWVTIEPDIARTRFEQHFRHGQILLAESVRLHPRQFAVEDIPEFDLSDLDELVGQFGPHGERSWTGLNIHKRVAAIEHLWTDQNEREILQFFRRIVYRDSNQHLHPTAQGLDALVRSSSETQLSLKVGPGPEHVARALWTSYWISVQIVGLIFLHFDFPNDLEVRLKEVVQQGQVAFHRLSAKDLKTTGRNDRCPCGSGRKFKHCHGA